MTSRTARHHLLAANLVLFFQFDPLICVEVAILPLHVEDLRLRPNKLLRLAMACKTPFHLQSVLLINRRHVVDLSVTCRAADSFCNVDTVVEVCEFGKIV